MIGMGSLWRHLMSNMSSKKPSMVAMRSDRREER